jgi:hypothetical protein
LPFAVLADGALPDAPAAATEAPEHQHPDGAAEEPTRHNHSHVDPGLNLFGFLTASYTHLGSAAAQEVEGKTAKV